MTEILDRIDGPRDLRGLTYEQLEQLSDEIRHFLVDTVDCIGGGGHLASNLGVVELSIALHRLFDTPKDKVVWDVSHQVYVHKILTGRKDRMTSIRQFGGLSGFSDRTESEHDVFGAGHAGTSISAAVGMAVARDLKGDDYYSIAVIGDGAMTAGMALEAMNHAGHLRTQKLIVVLNDNAMSISPNVGALSKNVNKIRVDPLYRNAKRDLSEFVEHLPLGRQVWQGAKRVKASVRDLLVPVTFWEQFGFEYYGPIDGHNIAELEATFNAIKRVPGKPVLLHILTEKGHGIPEAAADPIKSHSGTYWLKKPAAPDAPKPKPSYSQVFAEATRELIESDPRVVAVTAAMLEGTGLAPVHAKHPDRVFDVGIAEQHAVTFAAGLATEGIKPICAIYSTFLQRGFDSVVHDVVVQGLPVVFAMDRAGFVGDDGKTHQGFIDISFLRCLPNMVIAAPKDERELRDLLYTGVNHSGPFALRYPRGSGPGASTVEPMRQLPIGRGEVLREGRDVTLVGFGTSVSECLLAAGILEQAGIDAAVINARYAKPLDEELLLRYARTTGGLVTAEENVRAGGFGDAVLELLADNGLATKNLANLAMPDQIVDHGPQATFRQIYQLDAAGIAARAKALLGASPSVPLVTLAAT
ncbi:MAG: 1-deoxy-D-xylulose-5-phosphate synthase [Dehalococcoidia bacterium]|uniref:1-deoxy-D-xylulose-5-phosphate synthase n=1 Tax=Candidatus Amarobacter glycogenicus TaxID=3140699 RepID=UPI00313513CB|nr:1-deoxy-D-xylulose-5-phosphate synthase [Dehalococcoidia bacterium]MBK7125512.1 1-deoxy-D-xylulose-5-phosphate synthase [Dehalococcoidia bacterium]